MNHLARFICPVLRLDLHNAVNTSHSAHVLSICVRQKATLMSLRVGLLFVIRSHSRRTRLLRCWILIRECCPCEHVTSDSMTTSNRNVSGCPRMVHCLPLASHRAADFRHRRFELNLLDTPSRSRCLCITSCSHRRAIFAR